MLEWTIAFGYTFYLLTFAYDLRMAKGIHRGQLSKERMLAMQGRGGNAAAMREVGQPGLVNGNGEHHS